MQFNRLPGERCRACCPYCFQVTTRCVVTGRLFDPTLCTECVGHFDEAQCVQVCPVDCIPLDDLHPATPEQLQAKYLRLQAAKTKG